MQWQGRTMVTMVTMHLCVVAVVKAISDTWSVDDIVGRLDSSGVLSLWRDFSTTAEFPDPSDDYDRLVVQVEGFNLRDPGNARIDLLKVEGSSSYIYQPDFWDKTLHGIQGTGKCLKAQSPILQSSLSVFLVIFNSDGTAFKNTPLQTQVKRGDACIGVDFPSLSNISSVRDLCESGNCRMELSLSVQGESVSRSLRLEGNHLAIFDLTLGMSTKAMLTKKVFLDYHNTPADSPKVVQDVALSLATKSPSSIGVTLTLPLTSQPSMYAMLVKPAVHIPTETTPSGDGALEEEEEVGDQEDEEAEEMQKYDEDNKDNDAVKRDGDSDVGGDNIEDDSKMYNDEIEPGISPISDDGNGDNEAAANVKTDKNTQDATEIKIGASTASKDSSPVNSSKGASSYCHLWTYIFVIVFSFTIVCVLC